MPIRQYSPLPPKSLILPEDVSGRFIDIDPNEPGCVYQDVGKQTRAVNDTDKVAHITCKVSGMELTQMTAGFRMNLSAYLSRMTLWSDTTNTGFLSCLNISDRIASKLHAPLTVAWWVKPEVVAVAGAPQYHWEFYNRIEAGPHLSAQYNDPNDASNHKRFTFARRRSDTSGMSNIQTRVDNALYPNASIGRWIMLAMVHTGSPRDSQYFQYLDGVRIASSTGIASMYQGLPGNSEFFFGTRNVVGNFARSKFMRWVAWDRELTNSEILRLWWTTRDQWGLV